LPTSRERFDAALAELGGLGWETDDFADEFSSRLFLPADLEDAFDASGELTRDLSFRWAASEDGTPAHLQTTFAEDGLVVRVVADENDEDGEAGTAVCLAAREGDSDLCRIIAALVRLRTRGYTAEPAFAWTSTMGWEDISPDEDGALRAVFWNVQAHEDSFDAEGGLIGELHMQWAGDAQVIAAELAPTGLTSVIPKSTDRAFVLEPAR
jgi:hypothetical protein